MSGGTTAANAAQEEYWNSRVGQRWTEAQEQLDAHFAPITELLIERARPGVGDAVLDVGCGTGDTVLRLAGKVRSVTGADISAPMLARARERVEGQGLDNVTLLVADAQTQAFPTPYSLVVSRFGVMFFADPVAAFTNIRRAMAPGARLCFVCWAPLEHNPFFRLPLEVAVRHLGPAEPTPPRAPGPFAFSEAAYVEEILSAAGFTAVELRTEPTTIAGASVEEEARLSFTIGPAARMIADRAPGEAVKRRIAEDIAAGLAPHVVAGKVAIPAVVHCVRANRG